MSKRTVLHFWRGYLALLCVLVILLVPLYLRTLTLFEQRQLSLAQEQLQSGMKQLDQQMESLYGIAFSLGKDADYLVMARRNASGLLPVDQYHLKKLHDEFARLCLAQPFVSDCGLLMKNEILLTPERVHLPQDDYYGSFIQFGDLDKAAFFDTFGHPDNLSLLMPQMEVIQHERRYSGIVWLCSMSQILTQNPTGVFFATFAEETLQNLLMPELETTEAGFVITGSRGETLMRCGLEAASGDVHTLLASGGGMNVELVLSETLFTSMMRPVRNLLMMLFVVMGLAGVPLSVVLAVRASRPVRRLTALAKEVAQPGTNAQINSFDLIGNTVTSLASSVENYKQSLAAQQLYVREHVFAALLRETPIRESMASQQRLERFKQCFPKFPERYRLAVLLIQDETIGMETLAQSQVALLGLIESQFSPAPYVYTSGRRAVLLLDSNADFDWTEELAILRRNAREKFHLPLLIALSEEGGSCEMLHTLYQQTKVILQLAGQNGSDELLDVWQKRNFPERQHDLPLDYTEMSQLHSLLLHAEKAGVLSLLGSIGGRLQSASFLDDVISQQVFFNIRSVMLRVKLERLDVLSELDIPDYHGELNNEALLKKLAGCCEAICDLITPTTTSPQAAFASSVCRFINEHLSDSSLSVSMVADHFAVSAPTLQKAIRQEAGSSFFDYVEQLRYDKAVFLLETTTLPIAQIAEECGFNSTNSFYKAFKRKSSLTPAVVRQQARREE